MVDQAEASRIVARAHMYLYETAAKDGVLTDEEQELINTFSASLKKYERALMKAFSDGIISQWEVRELQEIKDHIIESGTSIAEIDGISKEEMNLLISMMISLEVPKATGM